LLCLLVAPHRLFLMALGRYRHSNDLGAFALWSVLVAALALAALTIRTLAGADIFLLALLGAQIGAGIWIDRADSKDEFDRYRRSLRQL